MHGSQIMGSGKKDLLGPEKRQTFKVLNREEGKPVGNKEMSSIFADQ